jgi:branched-chain amino acid transport system substrate-binding protein
LRLFCFIISCLVLALPATADITIGIAGPLSGQNAVFGNELRVGVNAAIAAVNAKGGIKGEKLVSFEADDACDPRRAIDIAKDFIAKDVRLVVGHFCSATSLAAAPTYAGAGILLLTPTATSPDLTSKNLWNVFRLTGRDDLQADLAATRIKTEGQGSEVVLISDDQAETSSLAIRFRNALPNAKVVTVKEAEKRDFSNTTAVYLAVAATEAGNLVKELRKKNPNLPIYGSDLLQSDAFGTRTADVAAGAHITFLQDLANLADPRRSAQLSTTVGATLSAYAAVEAFVAAANAKDINDARGLASWLAGGNEIKSIIGPLRFNASGDLQNQPYVWYQWRDGQLKLEGN